MTQESVINMMFAAFCFLIASCTTTLQLTPDSALEQQLQFHSLDRAVARLEVQQFTGQRATLDLFTLTDEQTQLFAEEFVIAQLKEKGIEIVPDGQEADLHLEVFVSVLGADLGETLFGLPSIPTPFGISIPELALYKVARNRGRAELQIYAFDGEVGKFVDKTPVGLGKAKYDQYKLLFVINFTRGDIEE